MFALLIRVIFVCTVPGSIVRHVFNISRLDILQILAACILIFPRELEKFLKHPYVQTKGGRMQTLLEIFEELPF